MRSAQAARCWLAAGRLEAAEWYLSALREAHASARLDRLAADAAVPLALRQEAALLHFHVLLCGVACAAREGRQVSCAASAGSRLRGVFAPRAVWVVQPVQGHGLLAHPCGRRQPTRA